MERQIEVHPSDVELSGGQDARTRVSKVRKYAFRALVVLFSLFLLVMLNLVFLLIVASWLPDANYLAAQNNEDATALVHRLHDSILPLIAWSMLIGTVVQIRRPRQNVAPLLMALTVPVMLALVELATGTYTFMGTGLILVPLVLIALLHPCARELFNVRRMNRAMAGLTAVAAAAWIPFAYRQAQLQMLAGAGDPHAEMDHWNRMASFALILLFWAMIGASDRSGWRLTAWAAGLSSLWYGFQALLFTTASAASLPWALAAIGWGVAYIVVAERRARAGGPERHSAPAA